MSTKFEEHIKKVNAKKNGEAFMVEYRKDLPLNARSKKVGIVAYKQTMISLCKGLDYDKTEYADGKSLTHELPWGEWSKDYENVIEHNGKRYIRFYNPKDNKIHPLTRYFINGVEKSFEELKELKILVNSFFKETVDEDRNKEGAPFTISADNILWVE